MQIRSNSFQHRERLPAEFAAGQPTADGFGFAPNRNPHLAWDDVPAGTKSFALLCIDPDVPTVAEMVGKPGVEIPADQPRTDFVHWAVADIPADVREIAAGSCSDGVVAHGKQNPPGPPGARQGLNDYTGWFAGDPHRAGQYFGYDGPFPPFNDSLIHHYVFTLYALDVPRAPLEGVFTGAQVREAIYPHVLAEATHSGTYTLNRRLRG